MSSQNENKRIKKVLIFAFILNTNIWRLKSCVNNLRMFLNSQFGLKKKSPQLVLTTAPYENHSKINDVRNNLKKYETSYNGQVLFKKQGEKVKQSSKNWS